MVFAGAFTWNGDSYTLLLIINSISHSERSEDVLLKTPVEKPEYTHVNAFEITPPPPFIRATNGIVWMTIEKK